MSVVLGKFLRTAPNGENIHVGKATVAKEVKANSTESVHLQPDCSFFRPEGIYVAPEAAPHFSIVQIFVGGKVQRPPSSPPTPTVCFTRCALGANVKYDTVFGGLLFTIVVKNNTDVDRVFEADIEGIAIK